MSLPETDLRVCKTCGKLKKHVFAGRYRGRDKRFVDEDGLLFNGHTCGSCNQIRVRLKMRQLREKRKAQRENKAE